jgi:hypothetical protein
MVASDSSSSERVLFLKNLSWQQARHALLVHVSSSGAGVQVAQSKLETGCDDCATVAIGSGDALLIAGPAITCACLLALPSSVPFAPGPAPTIGSFSIPFAPAQFGAFRYKTNKGSFPDSYHPGVVF